MRYWVKGRRIYGKGEGGGGGGGVEFVLGHAPPSPPSPPADIFEIQMFLFSSWYASGTLLSPPGLKLLPEELKHLCVGEG